MFFKQGYVNRMVFENQNVIATVKYILDECRHITECHIDSKPLYPSDAKGRHRTESTLAQVMGSIDISIVNSCGIHPRAILQNYNFV